MEKESIREYLSAKYSRYSEFCLCHVQCELLCSEVDAKILMRAVTDSKSIGQYSVMDFNKFNQCIQEGLKNG